VLFSLVERRAGSLRRGGACATLKIKILQVKCGPAFIPLGLGQRLVLNAPTRQPSRTHKT